MVIDPRYQLADLFAVAAMKHRIIRRKIRLFHVPWRIQTAEAYPDILPWLLGVGKIMDRGIGIAQEGVPRLKLVPLVTANERPLPANDIVKQEVIADAGTPAIAGGTLLTASILHIE